MESKSSTAHKRCHKIVVHDEPPTKRRKKNLSICNDKNYNANHDDPDKDTVTTRLDHLDLLEHKTQFIKTSDDHESDDVEIDTINVQIGDEIKSFEVSLLKQFAYFEARLDQRWTKNDKTKRSSRIT